MTRLERIKRLRAAAPAVFDRFATDGLRLAHRAGWPALLGGMLLAASVATVFSATRPAREELASIAQQKKALRSASTRALAGKVVSPQERLRDFYAAFPPRSALPDALMTLHRSATHNNLRDTRADYRDTPEAGTPLVRVRIEIPVSGSYTDIRSWIGDQLKALPTLTLDGLELRRSSIGNPRLDARVRFQLLLRSTP